MICAGSFSIATEPMPTVSIYRDLFDLISSKGYIDCDRAFIPTAEAEQLPGLKDAANAAEDKNAAANAAERIFLEKYIVSPLC